MKVLVTGGDVPLGCILSRAVAGEGQAVRILPARENGRGFTSPGQTRRFGKGVSYGGE